MNDPEEEVEDGSFEMFPELHEDAFYERLERGVDKSHFNEVPDEHKFDDEDSLVPSFNNGYFLPQKLKEAV